MSSGISPSLETNFPDPFGSGNLSIALIGPDAERRMAVAGALSQWPGAAVREFPAYPPALDDVPRLIEAAFDVIIIDLDNNPEYVIELIGRICACDSATVMVYSAQGNQDLAARCMSAGARESLDVPVDQGRVAEALVRAAALARPERHSAKQTGGKLLVFFGAKGGSGTTTLACNYAIALARESGRRTLLIDLGLPLGDAALNLGIAAEHSTDDVLQEPDRLDPSLLEAFLAKHDSGVSVLAAPSKVPEISPSSASIDKLMSVAQVIFDYVIVDVGSRVDLVGTALFRDAFRIYMVTQAGISELRNADRLISLYFRESRERLEIVVNRFEPSLSRVTEEQMTKALGTPVRWKIPDDYDAMRQMQNADGSVSHEDSAFSELILEMASSITDHPIHHERKKSFNLRGHGQHISEGVSSGDTPQGNLGSTPGTVSSTPANKAMTPANPGGLPTVNWPTPATIIYGTGLDETQLNATASVDGTFVYTPGPGYVLPVGTHTLWVTFTPTAGAMVQSAVSITVAKTTPEVTWATPAEISCDTPLSEAQLNAVASVPGTFEYSPAAGKALEPGTHTLSVTFSPADDKNYATAKASVSVKVAKLTPIIDWPKPADKIPCGGALNEHHLNAKASVPGTFVYSPAAGEVLEPGEHTLRVTFTPADTKRYAAAQANVTVTVKKAPPVVTWAPPDSITYGTPLSTAQLNATASVEGTFVYTPGQGALLAAGEHTPSVSFTPADDSDYGTIQAAVPLTVAMAIPAITWPTPEPIASGTPLSGAQLNATASIPGKFSYLPPAGQVLTAGAHKLAVVFTPADSMNYETAHASVTLTVNELSRSEITWPAPSAISYGTPLSATQLNATASVPGKLIYSPSAGVVLPAGKHTLSVTFAPADTSKYATAQATVLLEIEGLPDAASLLTSATLGRSTRSGAADELESANVTAEAVASVTTRAEREIMPARSAPAEHKAVTRESTTEREAAAKGSTTNQARHRETRTYKGVLYEKGEDGQWHRLQK
jgi:Flp pilus assembly CpaE family ATPase